MRIKVVIFLCALALVGIAHAGSAGFAARHLLQSPSPGASEVPQICVSTGQNIQSSCSSEINTVLRNVGVTPQGSDLGSLAGAGKQVISAGKLSQAVDAFNPSSGCCNALCQFTAQLCACDLAVANVVKSSGGVDDTVLRQIGDALSAKCRYPNIAIAARNCPSTPTTPAFSC